MFLVDDISCAGTQHGAADDGGSLCGIDPEQLTVVRNPFWGSDAADCSECAAALSAMARRTYGSS
jgi:hypothetical protein